MVEEFMAGLEASLPTRDQWIEVNIEVARIFAASDLPPQMVFVGRAPKDGTGDPTRVCLAKVIENLRRIPALGTLL